MTAAEGGGRKHKKFLTPKWLISTVAGFPHSNTVGIKQWKPQTQVPEYYTVKVVVTSAEAPALTRIRQTGRKLNNNKAWFDCNCSYSVSRLIGSAIWYGQEQQPLVFLCQQATLFSLNNFLKMTTILPDHLYNIQRDHFV